MSKIRVIHCLGQLNTGGAETLVMNILRKIDRNQFQFDFLLFNNNEGFYDKGAKELGSHLYYIPSMGSIGVIKYIKEMIDFFKKEDIDVVHSHMDWQGGFIAYAAYKAGIKNIVVHSHANQQMFDKDLAHHLLISINKWLIKKYATTCLACSKEAGESLFNKNFEVLLNGIDLDKFMYPNEDKIQELKKEFHIKDTDIILGNVGSLSQNKNQSFLIHLLYELHKINENYRLILIGEGKMRKELEQLSIDLGLQDYVLFTGVRSEIPEIMHIFDMFLFPSIHEGLGIVAIEAQASGIQCVASDTIPKSVDLGIDLIDFLSLDNSNEWIGKINNSIKIDNSINNKIVYMSDYNINNTVEKLITVYLNKYEGSE